MTKPDGPEPESPRRGAYNLGNIAYNAVSEMIHTRRLRGGETIVESRLAELIGVSRTPLREALLRLEGEGLVVRAANHSCVVRAVDLREYLQSLKVREVLEGEAAFMAAGKLPQARLRFVRNGIEELGGGGAQHTEAHWRSDDAVHGLLMEGCGNAVMARTIAALRVTTRLFEIANLEHRVDPDSVEHLRMVEALIAEDPQEARRATQAHIRSLSRFTLDSIA